MPKRASKPKRRKTAVVYAGGGVFGIAWHLAVTKTLKQAGLIDDTTILTGTSAGSWAAAAARLDVDIEEFLAQGPIQVPDMRAGALKERAEGLFGETTTCENVHIMAVKLPWMQRHMFDGAKHPISELVAASSSVPGLFPPSKVGGTWCIDGGVRSMASVDVAPEADILIVSLPLGGALLGPVGRTLEITTRRVIARWRQEHGGVSIVLRPSREITTLAGNNPTALFDAEKAKTLYPQALEAANRRLTERLKTLKQLKKA